MQSKKPIGIFGGTFDPIHFGHLRSALELYQALDLAEVRILPCYQPVHRTSPIASAEDRLAMVKVAIATESAFKLDDREIKRRGPSYMIDTIESLREEFKQTPLCLLIGSDALMGFPQWQRFEDILNQTHLVVAHRPQYQLPQEGEIADLLKERLVKNPLELHNKLAGHILMHPVTQLEISASKIRQQIAQEGNPKFLLPDEVYRYIIAQGTYEVKGNKDAN